MLVDHADAQGIGVVGIVDLYNLSILSDLALFCLVHTKQDAHQSGLTGTVLAQQCVDLAALQLDGDIVICNDAGEPLCNVQHLNCIRGVAQCDYLL